MKKFMLSKENGNKLCDSKEVVVVWSVNKQHIHRICNCICLSALILVSETARLLQFTTGSLDKRAPFSQVHVFSLNYHDLLASAILPFIGDFVSTFLTSLFAMLNPSFFLPDCTQANVELSGSLRW
jgi:hypothetical protein